ncbi:MAG: hypothetical protein NVS1B4_13360 [Gemmatimonadaceae bacterium]
MSHRSAFVALALACSVVSRPARSQRVVGTGDDVEMPVPGTIRFRATTEWTRFDQRYANGFGPRPTGSLEPLGASLTLDSLGVRQLPQLAPTQTRIRTLAKAPTFALSLGNSVANLDASIVRTPIHLEMGVTRRFALGVMVPYVRTRTVARFQVNPDGTRASVGLNPLLSPDQRAQALGQNGRLYQQFASASDSLALLIVACSVSPTASPQCAPILADPFGASALVVESNAFAGSLKLVYGGGATTFSPVVPVVRSRIQSAIDAQIDTLDQRFQRFLGATPRIVTRPFAAPGPFALADADVLVTDTSSVAGIRGNRVGTVERSHIGDIELGAKLLLIDAPSGGNLRRLGWRSALTGVLRLPTGERPDADDFSSVRTDDGTGAVEIRAANEFTLGPRFSTVVNARYAWPQVDAEQARITDDPTSILAALYRRQTVRRQMGNFYEIDVSPRYMVTPSLRFAGFLLLRGRDDDRYTGGFLVDPDAPGMPGTMVLNASTLGLGTGATEQRIGGGFTYSSTALYAQGRSSLPLDASFLHYETLHASGGNTAKVTTDQVSIRLYVRILGSGR